jgi:hypothetical protein
MEINLWGHSVRSATSDAFDLQLVVELPAKAKVTNFQQISLHKNVLKLEISMHIPFVVEHIHPLDQLLNVVNPQPQLFVLVKLLFRYLIKPFPQIFLTKLQKQVTVLRVLLPEVIVQHYHVWMSEFFETLHFAHLFETLDF